MRVPATGREDDNGSALVGEGRAGAGGACANDGAVAIGEERVGEGNGWIKMLSDEEVAVVEGGSVEADEELLGTRAWERNFV